MATDSGFWFNKTVLITGGTGFVGSWLVKELIRHGANIIVFADYLNPHSEFAISNLKSKTELVLAKLENFQNIDDVFNTHKIDVVFHLAAQTDVCSSIRAPVQTFETNIRGTYNLLEACRLHKNKIIAIIIISTMYVYGDHHNLPCNEDFPLKATEPYGVSKICSEFIARAYFNTYDLPVVIIRPCNIYGGGDLNVNHIIPYTIASLFKGKKISIRSDGKSVRSYIYVKDVVSAYLKLAETVGNGRIKGNIFNLDSGNYFSVLEVVETIQYMMKCYKSEIEILGVSSGETKNLYSDASKLKNVLKWKCKYTIEKGLKETIDWYKKSLKVLDI